jgi:nicotinamidase-related amidase
MSLDPETTAAVIVEMQNGCCHPDGGLYAPGSENAVRPCVELVGRAREAGASVVYTRPGSSTTPTTGRCSSRTRSVSSMKTTASTRSITPTGCSAK